MDVIPVDHDPFAPVPVDHDPWAGDPEAYGAAQASLAMQPAVQAHFRAIGDDLSNWAQSQAAQAERLQGAPLAARALDPEGLQTATNIALATGPGAMLYRAGGPAPRYGSGRDPTFYSTTPEGAAPYATHGDTVASYDVPVNNLFDVKEGNNYSLYKQFLDETGHPGGFGKNGYPFWTTEPELAGWLNKNNVPFDAIKFDENTGHPSIAVYPQINAYHGSPYNFDAFDINKIGTGEGAQAYGHGLYFADNEGIARGYRDRLSQPATPLDFLYTGKPGDTTYGVISNTLDRDQIPADLRNGAYELHARTSWTRPEAVTPQFMQRVYGELQNTITNYQTAHAEGRTLLGEELWQEQRRLQDATDAKKVLDLAGIGGPDAYNAAIEPMAQQSKQVLESAGFTGKDVDLEYLKSQMPTIGIQYPVGSPGKMYQVKIGASPDSLLHWDQPLNQQPQPVQQAVQSLADRYNAKPYPPEMNWGEFQQNHLNPMRQILNDALADTPIQKFANNIAEDALKGQEPGKSPDWELGKILDEYAPQAKPAVQAALDKYRNAISPMNNTGERWYEILHNAIIDHQNEQYDPRGPAMEDINAADALRQAGVPGIRYLDANSRNNQGWHITPPNQTTSGKWMVKSNNYNSQGLHFDNEADAQAALAEKIGDQKHNYVIFDDKLINILKKYGLAGLIAGGAMTIGTNADAATHAIPVDHDPFAAP